MAETAVARNSGGRFSIVNGKMGTQKFIASMKRLHKDAVKPIFVITDNARYHHSKATQEGMKAGALSILCSIQKKPH